jgi:hypothetical protein
MAKNTKIFLRSFILLIVVLSFHGMLACGGANDIDTDGDGVFDADDAFPADASESSDLDGDGVGDNSDDDIDGDGILNEDDAFPEDPDESSDIDGDGIGDNADTDADGDGVENTSDCDDFDAETYPLASDSPDKDYIDSNCDGIDGDESLAIWVSNTEGTDTNDGSIASPVKTIAKGIELAKALSTTSAHVYVVAGSYAEDVLLNSDVSLFGGFATLSAGTRDRHVENHETAIYGVDSLDSVDVVFDGTTQSLHYSLLIRDTLSEVGGLSIHGDIEGLNVIIVDANVTFEQIQVIDDTDDVITREGTAGMTVVLTDTAASDYSVTVSQSSFLMSGSAPTAGWISAVLAVPADGANAALELNINNNTFNFEGTVDLAMGIFAADNDSDASDDPATDGKASISLVASENEINLIGTADIAIGISMGAVPDGMFGSSMDWYFLNQALVEKNTITIANSSSANLGLSAGFVRLESEISNNLIITNSDGTESIGLYSVQANINVINNTFVFDNQNENTSIGMAFIAEDGLSPWMGYDDITPGVVSNNIMSMSNAGTDHCEMIGVYEIASSSDDSFVHASSPSNFQNNNIYFETECLLQAYYYNELSMTGSPSSNVVSTIADLNSKTDFLADDPTVISENISEDPIFVDTAAGDYSLDATSSSVDAGLTFEDLLDDILGTSRPQGNAFDIGAYESF